MGSSRNSWGLVAICILAVTATGVGRWGEGWVLEAVAEECGEPCSACATEEECDEEEYCMVTMEPFRCENFTGCEDEYDMCGGDGEAGPEVMLAIVAFASIFICFGVGCVSGNVKRTALEKKKRRFYRGNGKVATGFVTRKEKHYVSGGEHSSGHWEKELTVELQLVLKGEQKRASKEFKSVHSEIYDSCVEQGPIQVVHIAEDTGDVRHFELQAVVNSDTIGIMNNCVVGAFLGIFAVVGLLMALGFIFGIILPEDTVLAVAGLVIVLCSVVVPPLVCGNRVSAMYAKEKVVPRGTIIPPRQLMATSQMVMGQAGMVQPVVVVQPAMAQQPGKAQPMTQMVSGQPGVPQPAGVVQPVTVQQQSIAQPMTVAQPGMAQPPTGQPAMAQSGIVQTHGNGSGRNGTAGGRDSTSDGATHVGHDHTVDRVDRVLTL